jgi:hypothetical protein
LVFIPDDYWVFETKKRRKISVKKVDDFGNRYEPMIDELGDPILDNKGEYVWILEDPRGYLGGQIYIQITNDDKIIEL